MLKGGGLVKASVDRNRCMASGNCIRTCPEVFALEGGKSKVVVETVPKEAEERCREAEAGCPAQAISVTE